MAMIINHDGSKYMVERNVDNCKDDGTYKYVVRRKGKATNSQVEEDGYFFINDKDITYDQIMTSHYTSI